MDERERSTGKVKPVLQEANTLLDTPYIRVYDLIYEDGLHYYDASRKKKEDLTAVTCAHTLPDAVSGFTVIRQAGQEDRLLLFYEYRYPTGEYVLSIPSGLIDDRDRTEGNPILTAMAREITEETGLHIKDTDRLQIITPLVYNSPGMTDESTALVSAHIIVSDLHELTHAGAEGTERFFGHLLITRKEAQELIKKGTDDNGIPIPLVTRTAMTWFVYEDR